MDALKEGSPAATGLVSVGMDVVSGIHPSAMEGDLLFSPLSSLTSIFRYRIGLAGQESYSSV